MYNIGRMFGVISGVLIGLVIAVIMLRFVNKNKKMTAEYDEMQKLVRGRGYMDTLCRDHCRGDIARVLLHLA